jgi:hypothetical protein
MLAQERLDREDTGPAVLARAGRAAQLAEGVGAPVDGCAKLGVVDDAAVAQDHGRATFEADKT